MKYIFIFFLLFIATHHQFSVPSCKWRAIIYCIKQMYVNLNLKFKKKNWNSETFHFHIIKMCMVSKSEKAVGKNCLLRLCWQTNSLLHFTHSKILHGMQLFYAVAIIKLRFFPCHPRRSSFVYFRKMQKKNKLIIFDRATHSLVKMIMRHL